MEVLIALIFLATNVFWGLFFYVVIRLMRGQEIVPTKEPQPDSLKMDRYVPLEDMTPSDIDMMFKIEQRKMTPDAPTFDPFVPPVDIPQPEDEE